MADIKNKKLDKLKITFCTVALCLLTILIFYIYADKIPYLIEKISEKGSVPNVIWVIEHVAVIMPVVVLAIALSIFYGNKDRYVPVNSQREKLYISLLTAIFVYAVMLPYVYFTSKSGEIVDTETLEAADTLWDSTYKWFFVQIIPFLIMIFYHAIRADSEKTEQENAEG